MFVQVTEDPQQHLFTFQYYVSATVSNSHPLVSYNTSKNNLINF